MSFLAFSASFLKAPHLDTIPSIHMYLSRAIGTLIQNVSYNKVSQAVCDACRTHVCKVHKLHGKIIWPFCGEHFVNDRPCRQCQIHTQTLKDGTQRTKCSVPNEEDILMSAEGLLNESVDFYLQRCFEVHISSNWSCFPNARPKVLSPFQSGFLWRWLSYKLS